jgi:hypothetical protein
MAVNLNELNGLADRVKANAEERALLQKLPGISWEQLVELVREMGECDEEVVENVASGCWYGAFYFSKVLTGKQFKEEEAQDLKSAFELRALRGVHFFTTDNSYESHFFGLILFQDHLMLLQTYGGIYEFQIYLFDKEPWIQGLDAALKGNMDRYREIFQIEGPIGRKLGLGTLARFN